jgi:hypothetical protein
MSKWRRSFVVFGFALVLSVPLSCCTTAALHWKSDRVIKQWCQPKEIDYQSFDPYCLSVVEGSREWSNLEFPRRHYLFIGRGTAAPGYGHYLDYTFHPGYEDVDAHVARSSVEWSPEGVTFIEATGHRLFIPKAMFIGGR